MYSEEEKQVLIEKNLLSSSLINLDNSISRKLFNRLIVILLITELTIQTT
jgi:hypothetical protein